MRSVFGGRIFGLSLAVSLLFASTCGAVPLGGKAPVTHSSSETFYGQGLAALAKGDLEEAEAAFQKSLKTDPGAASALLGLADVANKRRQAEKVDQFLRQALALAPENVQVQTAWGRHLYAKQKFTEAETALKKAIALDAQAVSPRVDLGTLYVLGLNQPGRAVQTYREALAIDPAHAGARYALGSTLAKLDKVDEALQELTEASRLAPGNPLPFQAAGNLHAARKDFDHALKAYSAALEANPQFFQASLARGDVFLAMGDDDQAFAEYSAALKKAPDNPIALVKTGMIHQKHKRNSEAEGAYLQAVSLDPQLAIAYNNLAYMAAVRKEQLDTALVWGKMAVELVPEAKQFQDTLGWVHWARGEMDKAASVLEKAAVGEPQQPEVYYHLGIVYTEMGNPQKAAAALERALTLNDKFPEADDARRRLSELRKTKKN